MKEVLQSACTVIQSKFTESHILHIVRVWSWGNKLLGGTMTWNSLVPYTPWCARTVCQSAPSLSGWWSCPGTSWPSVPTPRCPVGHTACSAPLRIYRKHRRCEEKKLPVKSNLSKKFKIGNVQWNNEPFTWEEGSSSPELLSWKRIHPLGLQILPESHETSPPFAGNWTHRDYENLLNTNTVCKWAVLSYDSSYILKKIPAHLIMTWI